MYTNPQKSQNYTTTATYDLGPERGEDDKWLRQLVGKWNGV